MKNKDNTITKGFLYILTNSSIPGQVKIGKTKRTPEDRKKELSASTSTPTPFKLKYYLQFENCDKAEKDVHAFLEKEGKRVSKNKEFFRIELKEAIKVIDKIKSFEKNINQKNDLNKAKEFLNDGFMYLNGNEKILKNRETALEHFEQAGYYGSDTGFYMAGVVSEKIAYFKKRQKDKNEWNQRALNSYNEAIKLGNISSYAKKSWLMRKLNQHSQANDSWNDFLFLSLSRDNLSNEHAVWILRWLDNKKNKIFKLPEKDLFSKHFKTLESLCNKQNTPNNFALKVLKQNKDNGFSTVKISIIAIIIILIITVVLFTKNHFNF